MYSLLLLTAVKERPKDRFMQAWPKECNERLDNYDKFLSISSTTYLKNPKNPTSYKRLSIISKKRAVPFVIKINIADKIHFVKKMIVILVLIKQNTKYLASRIWEILMKMEYNVIFRDSKRSF